MPAPDFKTAIETIREHNDITEVIGSYVQLRKVGSSMKACCPFHKEKTPSFIVNHARQSFHCFGCGAGGDVFNFIMRYENLEFMQAAQRLAERAGLHFEFDRDVSSGPPSRKEELYQLHSQLGEWYRRCLLESSQAAGARAYLEEREIDDATAGAFGIGYAPARNVDWSDWAARRKIDPELLVTSGILIRRDEGGWYDRFADRLIFPIHNESGRIIGFSGRILPGDQRPAKYVNSPETPLFTKGKVIYALHLAKREILDQKEALLCEGQIDVIRCHMSGIKNAVAAQGTAVTEHHARILKRFADSVRLVLDSDEAGVNAALKSADVLIEAGLEVRVAALPPGDDPDTMLRRDGADAFLALVENAAASMDFQINTLMGREKEQGEAALRRTVHAVLESIARVPSGLQRDKLLERAGARLGVRPDLLTSELKQVTRRSTRPPEPEEEKGTGTPLPTHPPEEMDIIRLLIENPQSAELIATYVEEAHFTSSACRILFAILIEHAYDQDFNLMNGLLDAGDEPRRLAAMLQARDRFSGSEWTKEQVAQDLILALRRRDFDLQRRQLEARRRNASATEAQELDQEIIELTLHQHTLRSGWEKAKPMLDLHRSLSGP